MVLRFGRIGCTVTCFACEGLTEGAWGKPRHDLLALPRFWWSRGGTLLHP